MPQNAVAAGGPGETGAADLGVREGQGAFGRPQAARRLAEAAGVAGPGAAGCA